MDANFRTTNPDKTPHVPKTCKFRVFRIQVVAAPDIRGPHDIEPLSRYSLRMAASYFISLTLSPQILSISVPVDTRLKNMDHASLFQRIGIASNLVDEGT